MWEHNIFFNFCSKFICLLTKIVVNLHRYPENNLFTLKKGLIPIEDMKRSPVRVIALFFCKTHITNFLYIHTLHKGIKVCVTQCKISRNMHCTILTKL